MDKIYRIYKTLDGQTYPTSYSSTNPELMQRIMKYLKKSKHVTFEIREGV